MICTIYRLEKYKFYRFDAIDGEPVEDRVQLGYFSDKQQLKNSVLLCHNNGIAKDDLKITKFAIHLRKRHKYIYELNYSYTIFLDSEKEYYVDYDYVFDPKSTRGECLALKQKLLKEKKYKYSTDKNYSTDSDKGFTIEKYKLNEFYNQSVVFNVK